MLPSEGEQLIEALKNGEVDAIISRDQLFFLRLLDEEQALEQRIQDQAEEVHHLATELTLAEQRERSRLAELLHDHLQQLLVAAHLEIARLQRKTNDPDFRAHLTRLDSLIDESITATRSLSMSLAPPIQGLGGLSAALEWAARWMQEKHNLRVTLNLDDKAQCHEEDVAVLLFQCVRELLFNVVKHSGVSAATVSMDLAEDAGLRIIVSDEGAGFNPGASLRGLGLRRILQRLTVLGGEFTVQSEPGKGSRFVLKVPDTQNSGKDSLPRA